MPVLKAIFDINNKGQEPQELRLLLFVDPRPSKHFLIHRRQEQLLRTHLFTEVKRLFLNLSTTLLPSQEWQ